MQAKKTCPDCKSTNFKIDRERGEISCRDCGLIVEEKMVDFDKEWRGFDDEEGKRARAGAPLTYTKHDMGLGTQIGNRQDLKKVKQKNKFVRMMRWQYRSTSMEKNLKLALTHLKQMSSFLKLTACIEEEAARIYTLVARKGLIKGRAIEHITAGALYAACRKHALPRTLNEFAEASGYNRKEVIKSFKFISKALSLKFLPANPTSYISKFANKLKITPETESRAIAILEKAKEKDITNGKAPIGMTAASLYIATLLNCERKTQKEISEITGVTEVTIRNRYHDLVEGLNLEEQLKR